MSRARQIARYVVASGLADFNSPVVERAIDLVISAAGSTLLGATMDIPQRMAALVTERGGRAEAGAVGFAAAMPAEEAAMLNCISSHCTELEDVAWPEAQYTCCLIPAMLTLGQYLGASGAAVLEAIIIGFEVAARPGMICSNHGAAARGFLSCANNGTIGVAAGAAKLLQLDEDQTVDAITMAASMSGGLVRQTGSAAHALEAGFTARNGIVAAFLGQRGLGGNPAILDGKAGFFDALAGQPDIAFELGRGSDLRVMHVGQKKYPCCYLLQRIIDAMRAVVKDHGVTSEQVRVVRLEVNGAFPTIVKYDHPRDVEEARFSAQHVVAAALCGERMDFYTFTAERVHDPRIRAEYEKVEVVVHPEWGNDQLGESDLLTIVLANGETIERRCVTAKGDAVDPLTRAETIAKFVACTNGLVAPAMQERLVAQLTALAGAASVVPVMSDMCADRIAPTIASSAA